MVSAQGASLGAFFVTTVKSVVSVVVVIAVGALLVRFRRLDQSGLTALSQLINVLLLPISIFMRLSESLTRQVLATYWSVPFLFMLPTVVVFVLGSALTRWLDMDRALRPWVLLSLAFPNNLALPLVFLIPVCDAIEFPESDGLAWINGTPRPGNATGPLSKTECLEAGTLILFLGNVVQTFTFWVFAIDLACFATAVKLHPVGQTEEMERQSGRLAPDAGGAAGAAQAATTPGSLLASKSASGGLELTEGVTGGGQLVLDGTGSASASQSPLPLGGDGLSFRLADAVAPVGEPEFGARALAPTASAATAGSLKPSGSSLLLAASPTGADHPRPADASHLHHRKNHIDWRAARERATRAGKHLVKPVVIAQVCGIVIGCIPEVQEFIFYGWFNSVTAAMAIFPPALLPALNLVLGGSLGLKLVSMTSWRRLDLPGVGFKTNSFWAVIFARMVLFPALCFGLIYGLTRTSAVPDSRLLALLFYFIVLTPSANGAIVLAQLAGRTIASQALAVSMLFQYLVGIVSMSCFVFGAFLLSET
jgi:predicted permease